MLCVVSSQILQRPQRAELIVIFFFKATCFSSYSKCVARAQNFSIFFNVALFPLVGAGGLVWVNEWNALQHPVASAFLASLFSDYMLSSGTAKLLCNGYSYKPSDLRKFAKSQVGRAGI